MESSPRKVLAVDMVGLEMAFEDPTSEHCHYLDLETGGVLMVTGETQRILERAYKEIGENDFALHIDGLDLPEWMKEAIMEADRIWRGGDRIIGIPQSEPKIAWTQGSRHRQCLLAPLVEKDAVKTL